MALPKIPAQFEELDLRDLAGGGYNTYDPDFAAQDNQLTGGQNVDIDGTAPEKRQGHTLHGNYMGPTTGTLGLVVHEPQGGTAEFLSVYDTSVMRYVAGTWTALTSVTMTTNKVADSAYFPLTSKTYIVNQTDSVVKYTSGTSGDQTDSSFKKGKYIVHFKNRLLVANVSSQTDYVWYTDLGVDTFSANNYLRCEGEVTGMEVLFDKWLTFTKRKIYRTQNFTFSGSAAGPESFIPLPTDFGSIADRTIKKVGNLVYFLGQAPDGVVAVYATDGYTVQVVSTPISPDLEDVAPASLVNACAAAWGRFYRFSITPSGQTTNTREFLYDTVARRWLPPYTNEVGGFSCYATVETSGRMDLYAGTQGSGQVYKLNQEDYDEVTSENFTTVGAVDVAVDGNPAKRAGQSFKLSNYSAQESVTLTSVYVRLKKNAGTTTDLTLRIETDNNGLPSGTLADSDASATITAFSSATYTYYKAAFSDVSLTGNTTYWIVLKHATEGSGNSQYYWSGHATGTYTNGAAATYANTTSETTQTYRPDANPESTSVDGYLSSGYVLSGGDTFANIRGGLGGYLAAFPSATAGNVAIYASTVSNMYDQMDRGVLLFDTSSIPDDATISSATLSLYVNYKNNGLAQSIGVTSSEPASNTNLVASDWTTDFGSTRFATDVSVGSLTTNAYNDFALNNDGEAAISLDGVTKFAVRMSCDIDDTAPTWVNSANSVVTFSFAESGASTAPKLTVTYESATGSAVWTGSALRDMNFLAFEEGAIDGYADTKAFYLAPQGQKAHLRETVTTLDATGNLSVQLGVNQGTYAGFQYKDIPVTTGGDLLGSTFTIGSSVLGGKDTVEYRSVWNGVRARRVKFRFRNRKANERFKVYSLRTKHQIINKLR
jgi:hypothetical protein